MSDIPDWIEDRIRFNEGRSLQQRPVVKVFLESERPYLTRRQVQTRLKGTHSRGTVIDRLSELCEVGVLDHEDLKGGGVYWLNNKTSDWPIPPDVKVEPKREEMTVSEFFQVGFNKDCCIWPWRDPVVKYINLDRRGDWWCGLHYTWNTSC